MINVSVVILRGICRGDFNVLAEAPLVSVRLAPVDMRLGINLWKWSMLRMLFMLEDHYTPAASYGLALFHLPGLHGGFFVKVG